MGRHILKKEKENETVPLAAVSSWPSSAGMLALRYCSVIGLPTDGPDDDLTRAQLTIDSLEPLRLRIEKKKEINFQ